MGAGSLPRLLEWRAVSTRCLFGNCRTNAAIFLIEYAPFGATTTLKKAACGVATLQFEFGS